MDWAKAIGYTVGVGVVAFVVLKYMVSEYFKKSKELEELKRKNTQSAITQIKHDIMNLDSSITSVSKQMQNHQLSMSNFETKVAILTEKFNDLIVKVEKLKDDTEEEVRQEVRSQVLKLKEDLIMIKKGKQNG